jgi:hypothetical protein
VPYSRSVGLSHSGRSITFASVHLGPTVDYCRTAGVKEVYDSIWLVSFLDYDLGYIDLDERTLQPLDNPFWPVVLPMS